MDCLHFPRCTGKFKYISAYLALTCSCVKKKIALCKKNYPLFHSEIRSLSNNHNLTRNVQSFKKRQINVFLRAQKPSTDRYLVILTLQMASGMFPWFSCFHQSSKSYFLEAILKLKKKAPSKDWKIHAVREINACATNWILITKLKM